ncbi:Acetyl-CoA synthetase-like protein [Mycena indigotica]|uniref:Acetyl-CoA synthetase-like protein n=1 Tax=Mycena indigotica TaxID=2126181 RepID=A0A8H6SML2_9AGAR|nr:Acetyl-CoA synthetase-like protein [Mycena indigotica]KAF7302104.1 Acetyl-CoA synthetase-like protein [Mycena indigotica]
MSSTPLTILEESVRRNPTSIAFKVPQQNALSDWRDITYQDFLHDVELSAIYWTRVFRRDKIPQRSVIGLWIGGYDYKDVVNLYGIFRAGFVPQLFSLRLPSADVILELLAKTNAKALIYEDLFESALRTWPLPIYPEASLDHELAAGRSQGHLDLPPVPMVEDHDIYAYFHTSGSTSGSPKLVPCNYRWLRSTLHKASQICAPKRNHNLDVAIWGGSMAHIFQNFSKLNLEPFTIILTLSSLPVLMGHLQHNACTVQPVSIPFSSSQLCEMVRECGLNRVNVFASYLAAHVRTARHDSGVLDALRKLDEVVYTGLPLPHEEEAWALGQEVGAMLVSNGGCGDGAGFLRQMDGVAYQFLPVANGDEAAGAKPQTTHASTGRLLELVILPQSDDCPDVSLRSPDGNFRTGDLFIEVLPGQYVSQGRDDDWIKSESSLRCDTRAIEDNARLNCASLIAECIVVGSGRPSPILFVEPGADAEKMDADKLSREILRRIRQFHARRYVHERIASARMIIVVQRGALPRTATKGNIRRKAVEELYKEKIDSIFATTA